MSKFLTAITTSSGIHVYFYYLGVVCTLALKGKTPPGYFFHSDKLIVYGSGIRGLMISKDCVSISDVVNVIDYRTRKYI